MNLRAIIKDIKDRWLIAYWMWHCLDVMYIYRVMYGTLRSDGELERRMSVRLRQLSREKSSRTLAEGADYFDYLYYKMEKDRR